MLNAHKSSRLSPRGVEGDAWLFVCFGLGCRWRLIARYNSGGSATDEANEKDKQTTSRNHQLKSAFQNKTKVKKENKELQIKGLRDL